MRKNLWGAVGCLALCLAEPTSAADLSVPHAKAVAVAGPAYSWSGFYIGGNGGYATSTNCWFAKGAVGAITNELAEGCQQPAGLTIGGQLGYNWQFGHWVLGLEAQGNWADLSDTGPSALFPSDLTTDIHRLGLFTARLGYTWAPSVLLYVKGGAAAVKEEYHFQNRLVPAIFSTAQETRWGGALGLGVEFGITPNWSFGVEYNHLFLGKRDMTFDPIAFLGGLQPVTAMKHDPDVVTLRINYRFGGL